MYLRNVADYAEIHVFTHFYAIKSITQYSGGGVRTPPPEYCVMMRNFGRFLRKVWISNLLRNINFYAIKITRLRNFLRKCFGQAASSPASWFAPCCCAMGMLNFFCHLVAVSDKHLVAVSDIRTGSPFVGVLYTHRNRQCQYKLVSTEY